MKIRSLASTAVGVAVVLTIACLGVLTAAIPAHAQAPQMVDPKALPEVVSGPYKVAVGDVLEINFFKATQMSTTRTVGPDGVIYLPLVGRVAVFGRTVDDITAELNTRYGEEMVNPQITVSVSQYSGMKVYVGGEVNFPGIREYRGGLTLVLRSPWWVSLGIGIVLGGAGWALFPEAYRIAGAGAGLPFVVIAAIAAWKQLQLPSAKRVETTVQAVSAMSWPKFASAIEDAFRRDGHDVKRVESGPVDFEITKGGRTAVVGARRWKGARTGVEPLRALHTAGEAREASEYTHNAIGEATPSAREFAAKHRTRVLGGPDLVRLLGAQRGASKR